MGIPRPTGEYAGQMLDAGGWPDADEDAFYDRAQLYSGVLRNVTDVMDSTRRQQVEVFNEGVWSGGAATAANGALGTNLNEMSTLQDYLATVITWHRHIGNLIVQAKSEIGNNVDGAQRDISILENDTELEAEERQNAINSLIRATHQANTSLVAETAEQVLASKNWKPPHNALQDLLHQVTPPTPEVPTLVVPTPGGPPTPVPAPTPFEPIPANPFDPIGPGVPVTPVTPTPLDPIPANPYDPLNPSPPLTPVNPGTPSTPITPIPPVTPVLPVNPSTPGTPVSPITPVKPKPDDKPAKPVTPTPTPTPTPAPSPVNPSPVNPTPGPGPTPTPVGPPSPDQPAVPTNPGTSTPSAPGTETPHVKPAAAVDAPTHPGQGAGPSGPSHRGDDGSPAMAPAAATGMPAAARGSSAGPGSAAAATGASPTTGAAGAPSAGSRAAGGRAPLGATGKAPASATTRAASARNAPPARPAVPNRDDDAQKDAQKDKDQPADDVTALPSVPVSAARAARDAVVAASARGAKKDPLRLARRVAAALNARDSGGDDDYGFFWVTAVTTDGEIVVANSYGLAYIPEGVELPAKVHMASADRNVPVDEKARSATYPAMAVQTWAAFHDLKLRAVIGTAEQLANSDVGAVKVILEDDDIPESGKMVGRHRLEVVDPSAAAQLQETDDLHLVDLLPPAPADAKAPDDERHMLWFDLMKPMTSTASGREVAHLRAFHAYAAHCQEIALHQAYGAADAEAQRPAVIDFLYWRYVTGLLDSALTETP